FVGGASWSPISSGLPNSPEVYVLAIDPQTTTTLYAGVYGRGLFKSTNGGGTWSASNASLVASFVLALAVDPQATGTLYAGTNKGGAFKSITGGANWTASNNGIT